MDDRSELLRTQAMHTCMQALGAAQVSVNGNEWGAGGVFLQSEDQVTSTTYWAVDGQRYRYDVHVGVRVTRTPVDRTGKAAA